MKRTLILSSLVFAGLNIATALWAQETWAQETAETEDSAEVSVAEELGFRQVFGEGMLDAYENKTIEGVYPEYAANIAANIPPESFTEFHHDNATTTYAHRGADKSYTIKGIYTVKKDTICYHYNSPGLVVGTYCFYVFIQDSCYFHYIESNGVPMTAKDFEDWSSMAYAKEDAGTCLPSIS